MTERIPQATLDEWRMRAGRTVDVVGPDEDLGHLATVVLALLDEVARERDRADTATTLRAHASHQCDLATERAERAEAERDTLAATVQADGELLTEIDALFGREEMYDLRGSLLVMVRDLKAERDRLRVLAQEALNVVAYVSMGRGYIGVKPYPDALARKVNADLRAALTGGASEVARPGDDMEHWLGRDLPTADPMRVTEGASDQPTDRVNVLVERDNGTEVTYEVNRRKEASEFACLSFDLTGPDRPTHNLCTRPQGHQGDHGNAAYSWASTEGASDG